MIQKFITKPNKNGNRHYLIIDHDTKSFERGYNPRYYSEFITVSAITRKQLAKQCEICGYIQKGV